MEIETVEKYLEQAREAITKALQLMAEPGEEAGEMAAVRVTAAKTNAHFEVGKNKAGAPIMEIFPANNSAVGMRVQYEEGQVVAVERDVYVADGGGRFYLITEPVIRDRRGKKIVYVRLYLRERDVEVVEENH